MTGLPFNTRGMRRAAGRRLTFFAASIAAFILVFSAYEYSDHAILVTPAEQRRVIFDRALAEARSSCSREGHDDECRARARVLTRFPECDAACAAWVSEASARQAASQAASR